MGGRARSGRRRHHYRRRPRSAQPSPGAEVAGAPETLPTEIEETEATEASETPIISEERGAAPGKSEEVVVGPSAETAAPISERIGEPLPEPLQENAVRETVPEEVGGGEEQAVQPVSIPEPEAEAESPPEAAPVPLPGEGPEKEEPATIGLVIEKVQRIVTDLKESLDQMEQVLEMLEQVERQQMTDERDLKALRKALDALHRGRDHGRRHHPQR